MNRIYHFISRQKWELARNLDFYKPQSLATNGFIHCCTQVQIKELAHRLLVGQPDLLLLELDEGALKNPVIYEDLYGSDQSYPHLYGALNINAVNQIYSVQSVDDGEITLWPYNIYT